jgi:hypothetical protein
MNRLGTRKQEMCSGPASATWLSITTVKSSRMGPAAFGMTTIHALARMLISLDFAGKAKSISHQDL